MTPPPPAAAAAAPSDSLAGTGALDRAWLSAAVEAAQSIAMAEMDSAARHAQVVTQVLETLRPPTNALERVILRSLQAEAARVTRERAAPPDPRTSRAAERSRRPSAAFDPLVERALVAIGLHASDPHLRLVDVALETGTTEWQISSRLKNQTGRGFWAHLNGVRVARARHLLATTTTPVATIGRDVGYLRVSDFDRHFRRQFGQTPSQYRRSL